MTRRASPEKLRKNPSLSLVDIMPTISDQRPRYAFFEVCERRGDGAAAVGIVAAIKPEFAFRRQQAASCPCDSRCMRAGQSTRIMPPSKADAGSFRPATRSAAMAVPAFSN